MEGTESSAMECTVGSIVWVRRRNGSWWPGKILGPEELGDSQVMSPRSGTPVKLLGREDASVDWYNLEKSKRVKAFRCGEFDDCIERAEASLGMPIKKREKYARREDAILHALELEKQLLKKQGTLGIASDRTSSRSYSAVKKEPVKSSDSLGNDNGKLENSKTHQFSKRIDTSFKDELIDSSIYSQKAVDGNQLSGEDDNSEVGPRMRGLQDFGLRPTLSKRTLSSSITSNGAKKSAVDDNVHEPSSDDLGMGSTGLANGKKPSDKRKRSHEELTEDFSVKRRDRRRPLVQVLQSSAKLEFPQSSQPDRGALATSISGAEQMGVTFRSQRNRFVYLPAECSDSLDYKDIPANQIEMPPSKFGEADYHPHHGSLIKENVSASSEDAEIDSSESDSTESESDSSDTEPDMDEEMALLSGAAVPIEAEPITQEHGSMSSEEEPHELALSGETSHFYRVPFPANEAVSKWQLKGKRNVRNFTKRPVDGIGRKGSNGFIYVTYPQENSSSLSRRILGQSFHRNYASNSDLNEASLNGRAFGMQMVGLDNMGYPLTSRTALRGRNSISRKMTDWEDLDWENGHTLKGYWKDKGEHFSPVSFGRHHLGGRMRSMLFDVDLKVQSSYPKEPVPIVSLMSKLNGKAIIGHPIQIEALDDGSSENLLPTIAVFSDDSIDIDGNTTVPPAWRTARRTANFRVPRPHPLSALDDNEAAEEFSFLDHQERKPPFKKPYVGNFGHKGSLVKKNPPHIPRPSSDIKFPKKAPKKVSLSSSQKTRTLSSIAIERNIGNKPVHDESNNYHLDGLVKPESPGPPTVACIPVKLVFSRLLEKINRPPSKAVSNVVMSNSDTEKNSS